MAENGIRPFSAFLAQKKIRMAHGFAMSDAQMQYMADLHWSKTLLELGFPESLTKDPDPFFIIHRILSRPEYNNAGETGVIDEGRWAKSDNRPDNFSGKTIILIVLYTEEPGPALRAPRLDFNPEDDRMKRGMDWLLSAGLTEEEVLKMWVSIPLYYLVKGYLLEDVFEE